MRPFAVNTAATCFIAVMLCITQAYLKNVLALLPRYIGVCYDAKAFRSCFTMAVDRLVAAVKSKSA